MLQAKPITNMVEEFGVMKCELGSFFSRSRKRESLGVL